MPPLCDAVMPPRLPSDDVILPHTIATAATSGEKPILALALQVLFATATTASSCLHNHQCHPLLLTSPYNPSNIALFSLFVVIVLRIRFFLFFWNFRSPCYHYAHYLFVFMLEWLNYRLANSLKLCVCYIVGIFFHNCDLAFYCFGGAFVLDCDPPYFCWDKR